MITPRFSSFLLFSRQNVDFSLCLSIVIGCAYVVRTNPRTQSFRIDPVGVGSTYRRGGYRGAVGMGMKGRGKYSLPLASKIEIN